MTVQEQIKALEKKKRELIRKDKEKKARELLKYVDILDIDTLKKIKEQIGTKVTVSNYNEKDENGRAKIEEHTVTKEVAKRHIKRAIKRDFEYRDFR